MIRAIEWAFVAFLVYFFSLFTGVACWAAAPAKDDVVFSASMCLTEDLAMEVAEIVLTSEDTTDAGQALANIFNDVSVPCHIFPNPIPVMVNSVVLGGTDMDGDDFYVITVLSSQGVEGYFFSWDIKPAEKSGYRI